MIERVIELALGLGAAGVTTLGLGIFHPHSTFFGPTLWHGPRDRPQVALTFDDGPHPSFTPRIARHLEDAGGARDVLLRRLGGGAQPRRRARAGGRRPRDREPQLQPQHLRRPVRRRPAGRRSGAQPGALEHLRAGAPLLPPGRRREESQGPRRRPPGRPVRRDLDRRTARRRLDTHARKDAPPRRPAPAPATSSPYTTVRSPNRPPCARRPCARCRSFSSASARAACPASRSRRCSRAGRRI